MNKGELDKMKKPELLEMARSRGLKVPARILKRDLVDRLFKHFKTADPAKPAAGGRKESKPAKKKRPRGTDLKTGKKQAAPSSSPPREDGSGPDTAEDTNNRTIRQKAVAGKYYLTKDSARLFLDAESAGLPRYGTTRIVSVVRDPRWLFTYWEISPADMGRTADSFGDDWPSCRMILRVYNITLDAERGAYFDIEVGGQSTNWYINVVPKNNYQIGVGAVSPEGSYREIALSDIVETPRDSVCEYTEEKWAVPEARYTKILEASGELRSKSSSEELSAAVPVPGAGSESVSSFSESAARVKEEEESFVKVEIVLYGSAGKDSRLSLMGRKIEPNPDGTFSLRMELPEGEIELPMELVSPEGKWEKIIKATVETDKS
jgi:hypothetical protein